MSQNSLRVHILQLMKQKKLMFKRPKTVDMDRLCIFESLHKWWHDPTKRNLISKINLFFNAEETGICRIIEFCVSDESPTVPSLHSEGNHTTLFLMISAAEGEAISYSTQPSLPVPSSIV